MKRLLLSLIALSGAALTGCVVVPAGYYHHPRAFVVAPAPVVVVHPYR